MATASYCAKCQRACTHRAFVPDEYESTPSGGIRIVKRNHLPGLRPRRNHRRHRRNPPGGISWAWILGGAAVALLLFQRPSVATPTGTTLPPATTQPPATLPPPALTSPPAPSATQAGITYTGRESPATMRAFLDAIHTQGVDPNHTNGPSSIYSSASDIPVLQLPGYSIGEPSLLGPWMYFTAVPNWVAAAPDPSVYPGERQIWLAAMFDGVPWDPAHVGHWTVVGPITHGWAPDIGGDYVLRFQTTSGSQALPVSHDTGQLV